MYIGLDVGTSGTKAALVTKEGFLLASHQVSYNFADTEEGHRELDPELVWKAAEECLQKVGYKMDVQVITVSALGEAIVPIDRLGRTLCLSMTGTDSRGGRQMNRMVEKVGTRRLTEITGVNISPIYSVNKILWLKENRADIWNQVWKIFTFQDFIIYRLTGETVLDYSMASRTMLFDYTKQEWSQELLMESGLNEELFSRATQAGTLVGKLHSALAEKIGFPMGTPVAAGSHDHICNAVGSGVIRSGWCADTVGSTEGLTAIIKKDTLTSENIEKYQISCEPFAAEGLYNTVAWENTSGILLRWYAQQFMKEDKKSLEAIFQARNNSMDSEPTDLLVLPHFSGAATPYMDEYSMGAILGLTLNTKSEDIYKALMEGVNFELALILEALVLSGLCIEKIVATGGALSAQMLQLKADILGTKVTTVLCKQTGVLGGAILGAVAIGDFSSLEKAVMQMVHLGKTYHPQQSRHEKYLKKFETYKKIYPALKEINHEILKYK